VSTRLEGEARKRALARLNEIAAQLAVAFEREREVSRSIQRLRDEQRDLNAKVYAPS
jgi:hypothetical protein